MKEPDLSTLAQQIKQWAQGLGFQQVGVSDVELSQHETHLRRWLARNFHGEMRYMEQHGSKRSHPEELVAGTIRVISARMDYLPIASDRVKGLKNPRQAYIARYALGRDYHKLMRKRLQHLAQKIQQQIGDFGYRAFVDSAPVLERALAEKAGLGWIGKNTMLINKSAGSWFFLGEIYTDLPLPIDTSASAHCGSCRACLDICPTNAFTGPNQLDARRCISYLTIELRSSIPQDLRPLIGNRVFGCDDCQTICPWNKFATPSKEIDFTPRHGLESGQLTQLFAWTEQDFLDKTQGSAIRRIGYECWLRNLAVGLGNAPTTADIVAALQSRLAHPSALVREHVQWGLAQHSV